MSDSIYIVYETTNLVNGKFYIGVHKVTGNGYYLGSGLTLKASIRKYRRENFMRETLREFSNEQDAYDYEKLIVDVAMINNPHCYNIIIGGISGPVMCGEDNPSFGKPLSDETKRKLSESMKGRIHSEESIKKMSIALKGMKKTKEHCKNISLGRIGLYTGINSYWYGKKHTKESIKKMADAQRGKTHTEESKKLIGIKSRGRIVSAETRNKMSIALKGKTHSEESRKKMREVKQEFTYFIDGKQFTTTREASKKFSVDPQTITNWCKNPNKPNCYREALKQ